MPNVHWIRPYCNWDVKNAWQTSMVVWFLTLFFLENHVHFIISETDEILDILMDTGEEFDDDDNKSDSSCCSDMSRLTEQGNEKSLGSRKTSRLRNTTVNSGEKIESKSSRGKGDLMKFCWMINWNLMARLHMRFFVPRFFVPRLSCWCME